MQKQLRYCRLKIAGVYALSKDNSIFYVGISTDLLKRLNNHKNKYGKDISMIYLNKIRSTGRFSGHYGRSLERYYISQFLAIGLPILNKNKLKPKSK